ncbi:MAG: hydantoinase B/oxoprolinase family protein [Planctomycetes bacterium]|nr:hydantoinase B/oxoprolinase family protein [Planctomycetota bacterium]
MTRPERLPQFWLDVGGTFTDCFLQHPDGRLERAKVLSSGVTKGSACAGSTKAIIVDSSRRSEAADFWRGYRLRLLDQSGAAVAEADVAEFDATAGALHLTSPLSIAPAVGQAYELTAGEESPLLGIRRLLGLRLDQPVPPCLVRLGTTRGTNALLTRRGARTALVTTAGLGDILHIGYQNRPKLFERTIRKHQPLFSAVVEIEERLAADGSVLQAPDLEAVRQQLQALQDSGVESLAVCLLHAYREPVHEQLVAQVARDVGFRQISLSSEVAPLARIVARGDTTVVDAYLTPVLRDYVERLRASLGPVVQLRLMTSAGSLVRAEQFSGKDAILSGPAGGVVGFTHAAQRAGFTRAIGFDMGGTSTDVARFDGHFDYEYETEKAGVRIVAPMLAVHTVAAGGGSICDFDGVKLSVGPQSGGAEPGPACYGRGGPLCVTDVNLFLGRIVPEAFPFPLDRVAVARRLDELIERIATAAGTRYTREDLCEGYLRVANGNMARAVQAISLARGYDPREYLLVAFGGAAGQHACAVAHELGMTRVQVPDDASLLSAHGIGHAQIARHRVAPVYQPFNADSLADVERQFAKLAGAAQAEVEAEAEAFERIEVRRSLDLRYRGLDTALTVDEPGDGRWTEAYEAAHERLFGYRQQSPQFEIVATRVEVIGHTLLHDPAPTASASATAATPSGSIDGWFAGHRGTTPIFRRETLAAGATVTGPALVVDVHTVTVVEPGWTLRVHDRGGLILEADSTARGKQATGDSQNHGAIDPAIADPVWLEVFNRQFAAIAEQMGITLRQTARSVNVKERLDFSCAIFTRDGDLVVNAPHIPVHLGAMSETVRRALADNPDLAPGDVIVTNDPYRGGSHLPDVTVVTPIHSADGRELQFVVASRAHHAEIGGSRPGSMPPFSHTLGEEGVLIRNFRLFERGQPRWEQLAELLRSGRYPSRAVDDNLADIAAQLAANRQGVRDLERLVARYGWPIVSAYMRHIQQAASRKMRAALARLPRGDHRFVDHLDDGSPIALCVTIQEATSDDAPLALFDFAGTGPVLQGNLNANRAIVTAAVMYSLRLLIDEDIPLNQGVLEPVRITIPNCLLNPTEGVDPAESPAVVGGNVETSQRVVDVVLGALGIAAASQGTMNNLLFGDETFGYYETICGGSGATAEGPGADAVQVHMTNTRLTDPEILELRYPIRLRRFAIRHGSGGAGANRGGDGVLREIEFLRPLEVSILSERRGPYAPYGIAGGQPGQLGVNSLRRAGASIEAPEEILPAKVQLRVGKCDRLTVHTPGGGGYGKPKS